jgi:hypothetical protein
MKKIQTRLNKLSKRQLQEICKRIGIKCPKRKRDIVNKLLQPLEIKYKMEKSREQKRKEREKAREQKRKEREEARKQKRKEREDARELQKKSRELVREARKMEREIKHEERQRLIDKWKQEGKDNIEIIELLMQMNISE